MARAVKEFNKLPKWLPLRIADTGLTVERFSRKARVSRASMYHYIVGNHKPTTQIMVRICRLLKVPLEEGLQQYSPPVMGRPVGSGGGPREATVRAR